MTSFKDTENVIFELNDTVTLGVAENAKKYGGGYSIPVVLDDETVKKIGSLVEEHKAMDPRKGKEKDLLYLKSKKLADQHKKELLGKGRSHVMVHFKVTGTFTKDDVTHLVFRVTRLRKIDAPDSEDDCPEV